MTDDAIDVVTRGEHTLVPNGDYLVRYVAHRKSLYRGKHNKLNVVFEIVSGEFHGEQLVRHYNIQLDRNGRISGGYKSDLVRDIARIDENAIKRLDRIPTRIFSGKLLKVRVRQVIRDHKRDSIPEVIRYSVIDAILSVEENLTIVTEGFDDDSIPF